ncbi:LLM class flavin-dependent oxidoreductase [Mycobacterium simiae]|uniref:LLM class flavin-dependent oxidoreductase n=1 Tax=Mycobacterium simiae TaxID=1784 RepID=A0A5B1BUU0_MYCSI|nr:LLM class flavin-dependent oxidoreductase [Mycobacterium simiae]KAA1251004.1 LLM class flavin-dependent oxidoreductase [Mycobacterium simiae]
MVASGIAINQIPGVSVQRMAELAQEAERLGFNRCWVCDQGLDCHDIFVTLTAAALQTGSIRLGTGITHPYARHPAVTAAGIASLDELSGGRAFLGLGAGGIDTLSPMGLKRQKPLAAVRETIQIVRALGGGSPVDFDGEVFRLHGAYLDYARCDMEIWVAGRGPRMRALGGGLADGVVFEFVHKDMLAGDIARVRQAAAQQGNRPRICYATMVVVDDRTLDKVRPALFWRLADAPPELRAQLGVSDTDVTAMRQAMASGGFPAVARLIKDDWVRPFVIMGSVEECAAELHRLITDLAIDEFQLPILDMESAPALMATVARMVAVA